MCAEPESTRQNSPAGMPLPVAEAVAVPVRDGGAAETTDPQHGPHGLAEVWDYLSKH